MSNAVIIISLLLLLFFFFWYTGRQKKFLNYRKAGPNDYSKLKELGLLSYSVHKETLGEAWSIMEKNLMDNDRWNELFDHSEAFVCEDYNTIVGMAFLLPSGKAHDVYEQDWASVRLVGVHPDYTGLGIAKKLTEMCIEQAKQNGEKILGLHTSEFMPAARHIYEKAGFKEVKEIDSRFKKRYWLFRMDL